ncbi:hypothetical protein HDE_02516 [Halotydeus destructor]|nr:hypothetical protein HDE_02516 [Halotydeus destructor]
MTMQVQLETLRVCVERNICEGRVAETLKALRQLVIHYFSDPRTYYDDIKQTSYSLIPSMISLLRSTDDENVLKVCVYHIRTAYVLNENFVYKFLEHDGFYVVSRRIYTYIEKLLFEDDNRFLHSDHVRTSLKRLAVVCEFRKECQILKAGVDIVLELVKNIPDSLPSPVVASIVTEKDESRTLVGQNLELSDDTLINQDRGDVIARKSVIETAATKSVACSKNEASQQSQNASKHGGEESVVCEPAMIESQVGVSITSENEMAAGIQLEQVNTVEQQVITEQVNTIQEKVITEQFPQVQKVLEEVLEPEQVQDLQQNVIKEPVQPVVQAVEPEKAVEDLVEVREEQPASREHITVTQEKAVDVQQDEEDEEVQIVGEVKPIEKEKCLEMTIATQGGCRGCDAFAGECADSRTYMKLLSNNLTICPMHRYICMSITRATKIRGSTRGSLPPTPSVSGHLYKKLRTGERLLLPPIAEFRITRVPFALCEDRRLKRGVSKLGLGNWEIIRQKYVFAPARSAFDLQQRWYELEHEMQVD